jgi:aspartate/methionine/tyrosine aminotransferase
LKPFKIDQESPAALKQLQAELQSQFDAMKAVGLKLDLTRGKPSAEQLSLSDAMDGILQHHYISDSGTDTRNYGGLDGLPETKAFAADLLKVNPEDVLIGGNSSLTLMYQAVLFAHLFGLGGPDTAWNKQGTVRFLCPVPGYDRHFSICEDLGIEMIAVPMNDNGPDMDKVEALVRADRNIKGMWCVPRFSNPSGIVYSNETVTRIAKLGQIAAPDYRTFWDNAYAVHYLDQDAPDILSLLTEARKAGSEDSVIMFGSTSKITFAGAGLAYMAASAKNLNAFKNHLGIACIGPDKVNQLRHMRFFGDRNGLDLHMKKHAELLKPRFAAVLHALSHHFGGSDLASWTEPRGGYFVSVDTLPGLAQNVVKLASDLGVKLTPAGATFPYGKDEADRNIRIAPSFPTVAEIEKAMEVFALCVKLASVNQALSP